jgi:oligopeptide transport system substrate-binding protein
MLQRQLYDCLLEARPGSFVVPELAVRWEVSDDGRRYRFELDPEARWNDGSPMTAEDVVEGVRIILDPKVGSTESTHLSPLENADAYAAGTITDFGQVGVLALGPRTIEFRLRAPAPYWIFVLVYPGQSGARAGRTSGPFRLTHLDADRAVIARDPDYPRRARGNVGTVEWLRRDPADAIKALSSREADVASQIRPPAEAMDAIATSRLVTIASPHMVTQYVAFTGVPPYGLDPHLRKALAYAVDRRRLEPYLLSNQMTASGGLVPPGLLGHTPETALPFDPERARDSRRQSEHRGPLRLALGETWAAPYWSTILATWREILELEIESLEITPQDVIRTSGLAHAALGPWVAGYPDPEYFLHTLLHSRSPSNFQRWSSAPVDELIDRALAQESSAARLALFHEADRFAVQQECAVIPLFYSRVTALLQPWVHGWWGWASPWQRLDDLTIDERSPRAHGLAP